ncbi:MAG: hypothetical protein IJN00_04310 [Clostridia bacterium]|nr:hypothetical protein [Clostridia bacterium]
MFYQDLVDPAFLSVKKRIEDFRRAILNDMAPVWSMRKIGVCKDARHHYSYVVTLRKDPARPFIQRCEAFYLCLKKALTDGETLETRNECFTVFGSRYSISFSLEGYKKRPNQMGYYEWSSPRVKLLNRMGCTEAFFWIKKNGIALPSILERMNFNEMVRAYPNPADRFVASVNITKWQCDPKRPFEACYCAISQRHEEVVFHVVPHDHHKNEKSISALTIGSENAAPILSVINEFYPYFYARCFLEPNHLPLEMWRKIVEAAAQKMKEYLKEKSYTEAKILDVFIRWSEAQLEEYCVTADGYMFNITGYDIWY